MNKKQYDLVVYIGRFQPPHLGHISTIQLANNLADNVLILVGSANTARSTKNPWTFEERKEMILKATHVLNLKIEPLYDFTYNEAQWIIEVGSIVKETVTDINAKTIGLIGHRKDNSSYYLDHFPQWDFIQANEYPLEGDGESVDATYIRKLYFENRPQFIGSVIDHKVLQWLNKWRETKEYINLIQEYKYIEDYKRSWSNTPYPITFSTVDAVVVQSGHILIIERGAAPGKGQLALPGGFVGVNETLEQSMLRELHEETGLKVPVKVLKGSVQYVHTFDAPGRSTRGRTITTAFLIHLEDSEKLPRIKAGDDAKKAFWVPISEVMDMSHKMYEDHYHIIEHMLGRLS